jgi:hypothetical protein
MLEKTLRNMALRVASLGQKFQRVANRVAEAGERFSTRWAMTAAKYEEVSRLKSLRKPSVTFVRELKHGQKRVAIYNHRDSTGRVSKVWALSYRTSSGQIRLKMGTVAELRTHDSAAHRMVREVIQSYSDRREQMNRAPRQEARQAPKQHVHKAPRQRSERVVEHPSQKTQRSHSERPAARQERSSQEQSQLDRPAKPQPLKVVVAPPREEKPKRWYVLVDVESANPDGTGKARAIRSFQDLGKASACRDANPGLCFYGRTFDTPPKQGTVLDVSMNNSPGIAKQLDLLIRLKAPSRTNAIEQSQAPQQQTPAITQQQSYSPGL